MSIKVYSAYKFLKPSKFWETTAKIKNQAEIEVRKAVLDFSEKIDIEKMSTEIKDLHKSFLSIYKNEQEAIKATKIRALYKLYKDQLGSSYKDLFDFDVSFAVHEYKKNLYLIPYCSSVMKNVFNFLDTADYVQEYSYWNNVDQPKHISTKEWNQRHKIWDAITEPDYWKNYAVFEILTVNNFYSLVF